MKSILTWPGYNICGAVPFAAPYDEPEEDRDFCQACLETIAPGNGKVADNGDRVCRECFHECVALACDNEVTVVERKVG